MPIILSQMLEAYRWIGALLVLSAHSTNLFVSLHDIMTAPHAAPVYVWWFAASFELGHQAVLGFFVMSGYLVGGSVLASIRKGKDFLREYAIHRFARIYVVTVPALILTFIVDSFGRKFLPNADFYDLPLFAGHYSASVFIGNVLNFQEFTPRPTAPTARCGRSPASFGITSPSRCSWPRWRATIPTGSVTAASRSESRFFYRWRARRGFASASCSGSSARWRACRSGR